MAIAPYGPDLEVVQAVGFVIAIITASLSIEGLGLLALRPWTRGAFQSTRSAAKLATSCSWANPYDLTPEPVR